MSYVNRKTDHEYNMYLCLCDFVYWGDDDDDILSSSYWLRRAAKQVSQEQGKPDVSYTNLFFSDDDGQKCTEEEVSYQSFTHRLLKNLFIRVTFLSIWFVVSTCICAVVWWWDDVVFVRKLLKRKFIARGNISKGTTENF